MAVELNHTIVHVSDRKAAAEWVSEMLGLEPPRAWGPFYAVDLANNVQLDFADDHGEIQATHYAFLISEDEFDEVYGRIRERNVDHWADPARPDRERSTTTTAAAACTSPGPTATSSR